MLEFVHSRIMFRRSDTLVTQSSSVRISSGAFAGEQRKVPAIHASGVKRHLPSMFLLSLENVGFLPIISRPRTNHRRYASPSVLRIDIVGVIHIHRLQEYRDNTQTACTRYHHSDVRPGVQSGYAYPHVSLTSRCYLAMPMNPTTHKQRLQEAWRMCCKALSQHRPQPPCP